MVDVVCSTRETVRVNGGELLIEQVRKRFLELRRNNTSNEIKSEKFPNAVREKLNTASVLEKNFHITILTMTVEISCFKLPPVGSLQCTMNSER